MTRLKSLLFRQELKNRRVAKIKSKLYHKLKKKDKEREENKLKQYMMEVDPEAAKAYQEKQELRLVEERLRMRHGTQTKFAKNLKRFRGMDDKDTRDAYHQAVLDRQALTQKRRKMGQDESSSESESDDEMSEGELKEKAIKKMRDLANSDDEEGEEEESEMSDNSDDGVIKMDFSEKNKQKHDVQKPKEKGIQAMKFMQKSEQKQKEQLKHDTETAIS